MSVFAEPSLSAVWIVVGALWIVALVVAIRVSTRPH